MDLQQTKELVDHFFSDTDEGVVVTSFEPEEKAREWLHQNEYVFKEYDGVYCIAKLEEAIPSEERAKEVKAEMEERKRREQEARVKNYLANLRTVRFLLRHPPIPF